MCPDLPPHGCRPARRPLPRGLRPRLKLTVPAALLTNLYAGKNGSFSVATTSEVKFNAGAWPVTFTVRDTAVSGTITTSP